MALIHSSRYGIAFDRGRGPSAGLLPCSAAAPVRAPPIPPLPAQPSPAQHRCRRGLTTSSARHDDGATRGCGCWAPHGASAHPQPAGRRWAAGTYSTRRCPPAGCCCSPAAAAAAAAPVLPEAECSERHHLRARLSISIDHRRPPSVDQRLGIGSHALVVLELAFSSTS